MGCKSHTNVSRYEDEFEDKYEVHVSKIEEEKLRCRS